MLTMFQILAARLIAASYCLLRIPFASECLIIVIQAIIIIYKEFKFENSNLNKEEEPETKEPEMFEESNLEKDFEIPAFLRRQKN